MKTPTIFFFIFITCVLNAQSLKIKNLKLLIMKFSKMELLKFQLIQ